MDHWKWKFVRYLFPYSGAKLRIDPAFWIKDPHIPPRLYKYRSFCGNHLEALEKNTLWMSSADRFNDPYDTAVYFDADRLLIQDQSVSEFIAMMRSATEQIRANTWKPPAITKPIEIGAWTQRIMPELLATAPAEAREELASFVQEILVKQAEEATRRTSEAFRKGFSVLSLSENPSSVLMWSHYSDNHKGFCIEYDFAALSRDDLRRRLCMPVFYRKKMTDATRYMRARDLNDFNNLFGQYMCLLKSDEWAYEREWRIVHSIGPSTANKPVDMPTPSAVILGVHVAASDRAWMENFCRAKSIPLKVVRQHTNEFRLTLVNAS